MVNKIRAYINHEFENAPKNPKMTELKEELYGNLVEKYNDQIANGVDENEAYTHAVENIGDISELIGIVGEAYPNERRKTRAMMIALAVGIYILCPFPLIFLSETNFIQNGELIGMMLLFILIALATCMLIYNNITNPKHETYQEKIVEEFKQMRSGSKNQKKAFAAFSSGFWSLVVVIYLLSNFLFGIWSYSWVIFILAAGVHGLLEGIVMRIFIRNEGGISGDGTLIREFTNSQTEKNIRRNLYWSFTKAYWCFVVSLYFVISFAFGIWGFSWIIFIIATALQRIVDGVISLRSDEDE